MDVEWPKWRAETTAIEEKVQKDGNVQVVNLGPDIRRRANDTFWNDLQAASPQHISHLIKLMRK